MATLKQVLAEKDGDGNVVSYLATFEVTRGEEVTRHNFRSETLDVEELKAELAAHADQLEAAVPHPAALLVQEEVDINQFQIE